MCLHFARDSKDGGAAEAESEPSPNDEKSTVTEPRTSSQGDEQTSFTQFLKPKFARAPIKDAGRVAYLGKAILKSVKTAPGR